MFWSSATAVCKCTIEQFAIRGTERTKKNREKQASDGLDQQIVL